MELRWCTRTVKRIDPTGYGGEPYDHTERVLQYREPSRTLSHTEPGMGLGFLTIPGEWRDVPEFTELPTASVPRP